MPCFPEERLDEHAAAISKALAGEFELFGGGQRKTAKAAE
jgi:hypothetical protein